MVEILLKTKLSSDNSFRFISSNFNDEIYIYFYQGSFLAISGFCPHFGGPLTFKDNNISCYWHGWRFNPASLLCTNHKVNIHLKKYSVQDKGKYLIISNEY